MNSTPINEIFLTLYFKKTVKDLLLDIFPSTLTILFKGFQLLFFEVS